MLAQNQSVLNVGVDAILAEAGVAKASLYRHFGSKDELIVAWLDERQRAWFEFLDQHLRQHAATGEPLSEIDAAFGFLEVWLSRGDFSGCPFMTVFMQRKDAADPVARRARLYGQALFEFFRSRLVTADVAAPAREATALLELFLGAVVAKQMGVGDYAAGSARAAARLVGTLASGAGATTRCSRQ